jgi:NADPH2:quinone reductase
MALVVGGGYAEYCIAHESPRYRCPVFVDDRSGGGAGDLLHGLAQRIRRGGLKKGETLLIHGGSSGISTPLSTRQAFGARVITTAGS